MATLTEDSPKDDNIEERTTGCAMTELLTYPVVKLDPKYDYGEKCYEVPLFTIYTSETVQANFQKVGEADVHQMILATRVIVTNREVSRVSSKDPPLTG